MPPGRGSGCAGQRQSWQRQQPGKLGSRFSFYFYLGTQVRPRCNAEAPGGRAAFPSWSQIPSALPASPRVPDLLVDDSIFRGTETSRPALCPAHGAVQQEQRSWGPEPCPPGTALCGLGLGSLYHSQPSGDAQQPRPTRTVPPPGSGARRRLSFLKPALKPMAMG